MSLSIGGGQLRQVRAGRPRSDVCHNIQSSHQEGEGVEMGDRIGVDGVDLHWRRADAYDWENGDVVADIPYWEAMLARYRPSRVLDLACGTGRLTMPLAAMGQQIDPGFRITGLDISKAMIARAEEKRNGLLAEQAAVITFREGDMRAFALAETFDLVICGFNSFAFLRTVEDQLDFLDAVRAHLAPGGRFAIDLLVPNAGVLHEALEAAPIVRIDVDLQRPAPGIERVRRTFSERYDPSTQTLSTTYGHEVYFTDGRDDRWVDDLAWHMTFPRELELLLRLAGLTTFERYGAYDLTAFGPASFHYLWVMTIDE